MKNPAESIPVSKQKKAKTLHVHLLIFFVCLLFTFIAWDHYFNATGPFDNLFVSNLILIAGSIFSIFASYFVWSLQEGQTFLQKEVARRADELIDKERNRLKAEAQRAEAEKRQRDVERAYQRLQETQDQLIQAEKLASIGRVVGGIVHELNNPLITIQGYAALMSKVAGSKEMNEYLDIIARQANSCQQTVQELLTFIRSRKLSLQPVDPTEVIDRVLNGLPLEFRNSGIEVIKKYPSVKSLILADAHHTEHVISNILINAWHALESSKVKRITISILPTRDTVQMFFTDTGCGISKENRLKAFEPFFTTKAHGKGTGLGLSLCYSIVQQHGGTIEIESELEKGTSIFVEMPLSNRSSFAVSDHGKKKILVVDDETEVLHFIMRLLDSWGYEYVNAENGKQAVEILAQQKSGIDLVLLDVVMPEMNGLETLEAMKPDLGETPVIFLTGQAEEMREKIKSFGNSVQAVLQKPFDYEQLRSCLTDVFSVKK